MTDSNPSSFHDAASPPQESQPEFLQAREAYQKSIYAFFGSTQMDKKALTQACVDFIISSAQAVINPTGRRMNTDEKTQLEHDQQIFWSYAHENRDMIDYERILSVGGAAALDGPMFMDPIGTLKIRSRQP